MTEAANEIIRFAFMDLMLRRLNIEAFVENVASNNLIKKLGFVLKEQESKAQEVAQQTRCMMQIIMEC